MSNVTLQLETDSVCANDPRWELVERIIASPYFVKSPRLCSILSFICELSLQGRDEEINELNIGTSLFGRAPNYDPSVDGIVRSHASRLRQRLEQYFKEQGADEAIRLAIPKGGYVPVFEPRSAQPLPEIVAFPRGDNVLPLTESNALRANGSHNQLLIWILSIALALACGGIVRLLVLPRPGASAQQLPVTKHPFWGSLFAPDHPALVVCSDTGLTIFENLTHSNVKLAEYLSGDYRVHPGAPTGATPEVLKVLAEHRYTSIVDTEIVSKLYHAAGVSGNRVQVRYARDVRPNDLKGGTAILLGTQEGNPWVELFEDRMNFVFQHNREWGSFSVVNRSPQANEPARYDTRQGDPMHKVYGLVALRPNLGGSGQVLILEGTSMAGTESAADFVFDDGRLLPFLEKIQMPNGSLPYFELLLQSNNMNGNASQSEIVAYRTSSQ